MTTTESIKKAIDALTIQDVYLRELRLTIASDYDSKTGQPAALTNLGWGSKSAATIEIEDTETKQKTTLWKVQFAVRCRLLKPIEPLPPENYEPKPEEILATIESVFVAEYVLTDKSIEPEALAEFAQHNVAYHVWPYWREQIHDITTRALLPRVTLPMHVFKPKPPTTSEEAVQK